MIKKINSIVIENQEFNKKLDEYKKEIDEYKKEIDGLKKRISLLEKHNKLIVADVVVLSQNIANLFSVVYEHNEILNEDITKKNITYH